MWRISDMWRILDFLLYLHSPYVVIALTCYIQTWPSQPYINPRTTPLVTIWKIHLWRVMVKNSEAQILNILKLP